MPPKKKPVKKTSKPKPESEPVEKIVKTESSDETFELIMWMKEAIKEEKGPALLCISCREVIHGPEDELKHLDHVKYHWSAGHQPLQMRGILDFWNMLIVYKKHSKGEIKIKKMCPFCQTKIDNGSTKCTRCNRWQGIG